MDKQNIEKNTIKDANDYSDKLHAFLNKKSNGINFLGALQVAFIVLKLCTIIDWSWWLVLLPIEITYLGKTVLFFIFIKMNPPKLKN